MTLGDPKLIKSMPGVSKSEPKLIKRGLKDSQREPKRSQTGTKGWQKSNKTYSKIDGQKSIAKIMPTGALHN